MAEGTLTDNFSGILGMGSSLSVTPPGSGTTAVPIQGILEFTPPGRAHKKATFTTISGTLSGKEQVLIGSEQAATIEVTVVYEKLHMAAVDAVHGVNGCAVSLTLPDGSVYAGTGGIEKNAAERIVDTKEVTDAITIALNAGWTFTPGA